MTTKTHNPKVAWAFLEYKNFTPKLHAELKEHMNTFKNHEDKEKYKNYLTNVCLFPSDYPW